MPKTIRLESLGSEPPVPISELTNGVLTFGREPENSIVIDSSAVSRRHGSISAAGSQWVYRDFGSTNGSWLNGVQLTAGQVRLLRDGDVIKLADFPLRVVEVGDNGPAPTLSLLVFFGDRFEKEVVFEGPTNRFVVGGPEGNLFIDGESKDQPQLLIIRSGRRLELTTGRSTISIVLNGLATSGTTALNDRDEIVFGPYRFVASDRSALPKGERSAPERAPSLSTTPIQAYSQEMLPEHLRRPDDTDGWHSEAAKRRASSARKFVFDSGGATPGVENTLDMEIDEFAEKAGFEVSTSNRFLSMLQKEEEQSPPPISEKTLIGIGVVTFVCLLAFIFYAISHSFV